MPGNVLLTKKEQRLPCAIQNKIQYSRMVGNFGDLEMHDATGGGGGVLASLEGNQQQWRVGVFDMFRECRGQCRVYYYLLNIL